MKSNTTSDVNTDILSEDLDNIYISEIKNGNTDAINKIMEKYKSYVYLKAKPFFIVGAEREDIIQEGMIGLYKAIKGYNEEKDVSFKMFADLCIRRQIITAIKASKVRLWPSMTTFWIFLGSNIENSFLYSILASAQRTRWHIDTHTK